MERENCQPGTELSIFLVDDKTIAQLNAKYRRVSQPTDVLAFPQSDNHRGLILGDVVISLETAQRQARENDWGVEQEIALLLVHGILHLLGYEHQKPEEAKIMRQKEKATLRDLGLI